jgi:hypothetical protein
MRLALPMPARRALVVLAALVLAAGLASAPVTAEAAEPQPTWAPAESATVHPGVQLYTDGSQCTANFIFYEASGDATQPAWDLYIGYAAHCAATGAATDTNGCTTESLPLGTPVEIDGADHPGTLAYSSWATMAEVGETDPNACSYNDFALVRIDPRDHDKVNPSLPFYGGPEGIDTDGTSVGEKVYSYGNSGLRLGLSPLSPKEGVSLGTGGGGWTHTVYTVTPGIPGDSGSGFIDSDGRAFGVVSTVAIAPLAASNGVSDLHRALTYANANSPLGVTLADGTEPFAGGLLPVP